MVLIYFRVEDQGVTNNVSYEDSTTAENFMLDYLKNHTSYVTLDKKIYTFEIISFFGKSFVFPYYCLYERINGLYLS